MEKTVIATAIPSVINLDNARIAVVNVAGKTGEVIKTYGAAMCQAFNLTDPQGNVTTPWYDLKGKLALGVKEERAKFVGAMQAAGFEQGTIDVYWQRVKEASGYVTSGNRVKGSNSVDDKTLTELKTIINRIFKAEESGEDCKSSDVKAQLIEAFEILGGDVDNLG